MKRPLLVLLLFPFLVSVNCAAAVADKPVLLPQPKRVTFTNARFKLSAKTIIFPDKVSDEKAEYLRDELRRLYGLDCYISNFSDKFPSDAILLKTSGKDKSLPGNPEGYTLSINDSCIVIKSKGPKGIFYGIQTLKQLLQLTGTGVVARGCEMWDEPALGWRGIYMNIHNIGRQESCIAEVKNVFNSLASLKMNTLFLEVSDGVVYDKQQFPLTASRALSKKQVRELVEYAKSLHFEVIPYLQVLTHTMWILSNPTNMELQENSNTDWNISWCPSNPAVDQFQQDMLQETMEMFQPKYFHIGMDEIYICPFGECPRCKGKDPAELFRQSIMKAHDILADNGVKTIMWQDSLLPPDVGYYTKNLDKAHGWQIVDKLPKDIIISDGDYGIYDGKARSRLKYFTNKGFKLVGAPFISLKGIQTFADGLSKEPAALGMFDTVWFYILSWDNPTTVAPEAWASVALTAQYSWNPGNPQLREIGYDPVHEITKTLQPVQRDTDWSPVPLSASFNYRISGALDSWPGYGIGDTIESVFGQPIKCGGVAFSTAGKGVGNNVILLSAQEDDGLPTGYATVPVNRKAAKLAFLLTCNVPLNKDSLTGFREPCKKPLVGRCIILYEDGTTAESSLHYKLNIVDWNYKLGVLEGRIAYAGETRNGSRIQLMRTDWTNPYPEKGIKSLAFESVNADGMSPAIFAVSAQAVGGRE